jgi:hypothetical protein
MESEMSHSGRFRYIGVTLVGAVFVLLYRGPNWPFVRGYMGDWLVVQFIYLIARFWVSYRWRFHLAGSVLLLGLLVEVIQFVGAGFIPRTFVAEVTIGSTFDPLDMIAFMLGLATVLGVEQMLAKRYSTA